MQRDRRESDLESMKSRIEAVNQTLIRSTEDFNAALKKYEEWKKENGVEGIKF